MRKLFLLIPFLFFALAAKANVIDVYPTTPNSTDNIRRAVRDNASAGDVIRLMSDDAIYIESSEHLTLDKDITIIAAEGKHPIVQLSTYPVLKSGAKVSFVGIKFTGNPSSAQYGFRPYDDTAGKEMRFENCEFSNFSSYVFYGSSSYPMDSLIINNCYFHDNTNSVIYFPKGSAADKQTCNGVIVTNSTFVNINTTGISASVIDIQGYNYGATPPDTTNIKVRLDHCTFYNDSTKNTDYSAIRVRISRDVIVSNCIFAHPESYDRPATSCYAGTVRNCLTYNLTTYSGRNGHRQENGTPTLSDNITGNPVFKDAANNDFTLLNASSARRLGTVYGDPRWFKDIDTIAIPATLLPQDALLSDSASVVEGEPARINFKFCGDNTYNSTEWAKWRIKVNEYGFYKFTANVTATTGQKYNMYVLSADESVIKGQKIGEDTYMSAGTTTFAIDNAIELSAGDYIVKIMNPYSGSDGSVINVMAEYAGGKNIVVPDTLWPKDALRSALAFVEDDSLHFTPNGQYGYIREQWGKWNISVAEAGKYAFTANAFSDNGQNYRITLKNEDETSIIGTWYGPNNSSGARKIVTEMVDLSIGNYVLMIQDTVNHSHGRVANIVASYEGGKTVNVPGQILAKEAVIGQKEGGHAVKMFHIMENGDLQYNDNSYNLEEYATWTINATEAGKMAVTLNVVHIPQKGHTFSIELYQGNTRLDSIGEDASTTWDYGDILLPNQLNIPAVGSYTLKLLNNQQYSGGALHGITFAPYVAPAGVTMTDTDTDNSAWAANVGGAAVDVTLNRTIIGGMYNTICLPFKVSGTQCEAVFGNDVELYTLGSATLSGDILNLQFDVAHDIWNGTPILIKTSSDIVNPIFEGVTIESATGDHTSGAAATFRGTFVAKEFHSGDQVLLLLANNKLAFPQSDKTLKGFRAYFEINGGSSAAPIRSARIVTPNNMPTEINLVEQENNGVVKTIENGQLIIIRDGVRYNALGEQLK